MVTPVGVGIATGAIEAAGVVDSATAGAGTVVVTTGACVVKAEGFVMVTSEVNAGTANAASGTVEGDRVDVSACFLVNSTLTTITMMIMMTAVTPTPTPTKTLADGILIYYIHLNSSASSRHRDKHVDDDVSVRVVGLSGLFDNALDDHVI